MLGTGKSTHHCPKKSKGGCRANKALGYCTTHQTKCKEHGWVHLIDEPCVKCKSRDNKIAPAKRRDGDGSANKDGYGGKGKAAGGGKEKTGGNGNEKATSGGGRGDASAGGGRMRAYAGLHTSEQSRKVGIQRRPSSQTAIRRTKAMLLQHASVRLPESADKCQRMHRSASSGSDGQGAIWIRCDGTNCDSGAVEVG